MKTRQPTTQQASVAEYLEDDVDDETDESTTVTVDGGTRPEYIESDVDPTTEVYLSDRRYHRDRGGIPGCPEGHALPRSTIAEAARRGIPPCQKCNPADYRIKREESENASLEAFRTARGGSGEP